MDARLSVKVSADAKEASAAFSALAKDIKAVGTESIGVTDGVSRVDAAMAKLAKAPDTAMGLARAVAKAKVEIEDLRAALDKTPASAEKLKAIQAALAGAESAIQGATLRAGRLKDAMGDTAAAAANVGDKFDAARRASGGLSGAFESMRSTGTGATAAIGALGVGVSVAATAMMGAIAQGKQLAQFIDEWDAKRAKADKATADAAVNAALLDQANRAVTRGLIEQGKTSDETIERYVRLTVQMGKLTEQGRSYLASVAGLKAPPAWAEIERRADAMVVALAGAYKRGEVEGNRWTLENDKAIKGVIAAYDEVGKKAPEELGKALAAAEKWAEGNRKAADAARSIVPAISELSAALEGLDAAMISAASGSTEALTKLYLEASKNADTMTLFRREVLDSIPAVQASTVVNDAYAGSVKEINDAYLKTQAAHEQAVRVMNEQDLAMASLAENAAKVVYAIDSIGEAWQRASGHAAGFTVEVRHATKAVEETTPQFKALIESLAGTSDEYARMTPYVGALIAALERGDITTAEFEKTINSLRVAFMQIQGVSGQMFGDIDTLFNKLTKLVNDFTYGEKRGRK